MLENQRDHSKITTCTCIYNNDRSLLCSYARNFIANYAAMYASKELAIELSMKTYAIVDAAILFKLHDVTNYY